MNKLAYSGVGIHIKVANIEASRKFYEDLLDLRPVFGYGDADFRKTLPTEIPSVTGDGLPGAPEKYRGVTYEPTPQSPIEIAEGHIAVPDPSVYTTPVPSPKISAMVRVSSLQPLIVSKGMRPSFPIRHYYWGTIEAAIKDPDGFVIVLIAPYSPSEAAVLGQYVTVEQVSA